MKFWKYITENRYGYALWMTIIAILLSAILGSLLSLIAGSFWYMTQCMFWFFCAPCVVSALLLVLTNIEIDLVWGFGCGLYYGSVFLIAIFEKIVDKSLPYIAGISLTIAICYLTYLKKFSNRRNDDLKSQKPNFSISKNEYFDNKEVEEYARYLMKEATFSIEYEDALEFSQLLHRYTVVGKKETVENFFEFNKRFFEKFGAISPIAITMSSYFMGALNANGIISNDELDEMSENLIDSIGDIISKQ